jgi:hypothetical protein
MNTKNFTCFGNEVLPAFFFIFFAYSCLSLSDCDSDSHPFSGLRKKNCFLKNMTITNFSSFRFLITILLPRRFRILFAGETKKLALTGPVPLAVFTKSSCECWELKYGQRLRYFSGTAYRSAQLKRQLTQMCYHFMEKHSNDNRTRYARPFERLSRFLFTLPGRAQDSILMACRSQLTFLCASAANPEKETKALKST